MSSVVIRISPNRLGALLKEEGGLTVADAVQAARDNLQTIRQSCIEGLEAAVERMKAVADDEAVAVAERRGRIYRISNEVFGTAGSLEMEHLSEAAYSLCEAVDRMSAAGRWHEPTITVHLAAINRLLCADGDPDTCAQIIRGLRQVAVRQ